MARIAWVKKSDFFLPDTLARKNVNFLLANKSLQGIIIIIIPLHGKEFAHFGKEFVHFGKNLHILARWNLPSKDKFGEAPR